MTTNVDGADVRAQDAKPRKIEIGPAGEPVLVAEDVLSHAGEFIEIQLPNVEHPAYAVPLNREQALALSAFLAHWAKSLSPTSDYFEAEELPAEFARLAPWFSPADGGSR